MDPCTTLTGLELLNFIMDTINENKLNEELAFSIETDNTNYNWSGIEELQLKLPKLKNLKHIGCNPHIFNLVIEALVDSFPLVQPLIKQLKLLFHPQKSTLSLKLGHHFQNEFHVSCRL
jgi:hypothetical protein